MSLRSKATPTRPLGLSDSQGKYMTLLYLSLSKTLLKDFRTVTFGQSLPLACDTVQNVSVRNSGGRLSDSAKHLILCGVASVFVTVQKSHTIRGDRC